MAYQFTPRWIVADCASRDARRPIGFGLYFGLCGLRGSRRGRNWLWFFILLLIGKFTATGLVASTEIGFGLYFGLCGAREHGGVEIGFGFANLLLLQKSMVTALAID